MAIRTAFDQFNSRYVVSDTGCWEWTGYRMWKGYAVFKPLGSARQARAHRWSYEHFVGPIPDGMVIDHLCLVRHCVNPAHLEVVTPAENTRRGRSGGEFSSAKTHCPQGHPYSGENLLLRSDGRRVCRTCKNKRNREYDTRTGRKR